MDSLNFSVHIRDTISTQLPENHDRTQSASEGDQRGISLSLLKHFRILEVNWCIQVHFESSEGVGVILDRFYTHEVTILNIHCITQYNLLLSSIMAHSFIVGIAFKVNLTISFITILVSIIVFSIRLFYCNAITADEICQRRKV